MSSTDTSEPGWPERVVVLGGGRWARVLTGELCKILPSHSTVMVCSPNGWRDTLAWVDEQHLGARVSVSANRHAEPAHGRTAAVVACASRDHAAVACVATEYADAVLVEKPFAMSETEAARMEAVARARDVLLCPAHVFLFTRYFPNFARRFAQLGVVRQVTLQWEDARAERRYGESKAYDSSISVFTDVLPHAVSVLASLFGEKPQRAELLELDHGGASVAVRLHFRHFACDAQLARDRSERCRRLIVEATDGVCSIDWTAEPGVIHANGQAIYADDRWGVEGGPLSEMLTAFLRAAGGGVLDSRLSLEAAMAAASLTGALHRQYQPRLLAWTTAELAARAGISDHPPDEALLYALRELLQASGRLDRATLSDRMEHVLAACDGQGSTPAQVLAGLEADRP